MILSHKQRNWRSTLLTGGLLLIALGLGAPRANAQNPPAGTVHSVVLTWQAPNPVGGSGTIEGYNVYRATSGVNYTKLNSTPISGLTMTDATVVSGTTYGYCAATVDSTQHESPCTIPVNASIPSNPNIPTALGATVQ